MFRDVGSLAALRGDRRFALTRAGFSTLLPYGFLAAAALATAIHLILSALHAPFRLLPLLEPGFASQGTAPSILMAASVAGLLATLAALGIGGLHRYRAGLEQDYPADSATGAITGDAAVEAFDASTTSGFLVLFQVEHFAFISSRYGSDAAHGALRIAMEELSRTFAAPHRVKRSGDEFIVMAALRSHDDCILLVEDARRSVAMRTITAGRTDLTVSLTAGIAQIEPNLPTLVPLEAARRAVDYARNSACARPVFAFEGHAKVLS